MMGGAPPTMARESSTASAKSASHGGAASGSGTQWKEGPGSMLRFRFCAAPSAGDGRLLSPAGMLSCFQDTLGTFPGTFLGHSRTFLAFVPGLDAACPPLLRHAAILGNSPTPAFSASPTSHFLSRMAAGRAMGGGTGGRAGGGFGCAAACPVPGAGVLLPLSLLSSHLRPDSALDARCGVAWGLALACAKGALPCSGWRHEWMVPALAYHLCWQWLERALGQPGNNGSGNNAGAEARIRVFLAQRVATAMAEAAVQAGPLCPPPAVEDETDPGWDREVAGLTATDTTVIGPGSGTSSRGATAVRPLAGVEVAEGDPLPYLLEPWRSASLGARTCLLLRSLASTLGAGPSRHALRRAAGQAAAAAAATGTRQRQAAAAAELEATARWRRVATGGDAVATGESHSSHSVALGTPKPKLPQA